MANSVNIKMTKINYLIFKILLFVSFYSCSSNDKNAPMQAETVIIRDTIYLNSKETPITTVYEEGNLSSIINIAYLTMLKVSYGDRWKNKLGEEYFYRLVFTSIEECEQLYVEKIGWINNESDHLKLVSRAEIRDKDFDGNWWYDCVPKIEWISPTVVKLSFTTDDLEDRSEKEFYLDISKINFNQNICR
jgi:hypothetical protein